MTEKDGTSVGDAMWRVRQAPGSWLERPPGGRSLGTLALPDTAAHEVEFTPWLALGCRKNRGLGPCLIGWFSDGGDR